ncbi:hypothetical protein ASG40_10015 [Methylobacterium sp. Leaf399]|uniref:hypothetical protein n=1 Tax=unclassified Methylobacterium TaxID=2615210 RepID=UPI0006F472BD|nr:MULTISPECIES: hypothetical protein [unclassified Methylobacterium]KQP58182.1 hypothetical protein ASF39_18480 [Methylobacterium sp. Leaf108]KQT10036.1 hypothetical protein ASG40_10015 [Methylobacterium sp. Leaf399]KQT87205.1 hypothetical protein ASG59_16485 [Methylobacterium sp. Leaf466]
MASIGEAAPIVRSEAGEAGQGTSAEVVRLERSVAFALDLIATARHERDAAPVQAARRNLAAVYGLTRLRRRQEQSDARPRASA